MEGLMGVALDTSEVGQRAAEEATVIMIVMMNLMQ